MPDHRFPSHGETFFLLPMFSDSWAERVRTPAPWDVDRLAGTFACPNAAPPRLYRLTSPIRALARTGFAIMGRGLISGRLFCHFPDGFREVMIYKGTMGTWEQATSDRQNAAPLELVSVFPSPLPVLGTWEQKWPTPMQENPRACGYPLPPPAGERD